MANTSLHEEIAAHRLFDKTKVVSLETKSASVFKEALRQQVLDTYLTNITTNKPMFAHSFLKKLALFSVVAILIVGAYLVGSNTLSSKIFTKTLGLELTFSEGNIEYQRDGSWMAATPDTSFKQGDTIRVAEGGRAILTIDDGSALRLNGNSSVVLTSLNPKSIVVTNTTGEVFARVAKSTERTFVVMANGVEYKAQGTAYRVSEFSEKKGVDVFASKVDVIENGKTTTVEQGNKYYVVDKKTPTNEKKVEQIIKEDDLATDAFVAWNIACDESDAEYKEDLGIFKDTTAPTLSVTSPKNGAKTTSSTVTVLGTVEKDAKVSVNGAFVDNKDGSFTKKLTIAKGYTNITVKAIDAAGNVAKVVVKVKREDPPAPKPTTAPVSTGITLYKIASGKIGWKVTGISTPNGFKVIWSNNSGPTYPTRSYDADKWDYLSDPGSRAYYSTEMVGQYVRVCQYLGGKCGTYSNQIRL